MSLSKIVDSCIFATNPLKIKDEIVVDESN